jgi:VanZ family protein
MNLTRLWWGLGVFLFIAAAIVCLVPMQQVHKEFDVNDKVSHLIGHGALAAYFSGLVPRQRWWKIFAFLLLFGISVEFAQYFMDLGRQGDRRDVIANLIGASLGLLAGRLGISRWPELAGRLLGQRSGAR